MLSRLALRKAFQLKSAAPSLVGGCTRFSSSQGSEDVLCKEGSERDVVNFPRLTRQEFPSKVRHGFIPEEWFELFYKKTGVTGPYVLGVGLPIYLLSKEIWVIEHDFGYVFAFFGLVYYINMKVGSKISGWLDKQVDEADAELRDSRLNHLKWLEDAIKEEEEAQWRAEGQYLLLDAKRENVKLQLEATYRERAMKVYSEVKKRLDYQLEKQRVDQVIAQKHMVQWVVSNVLKSISDAQEKENIKKCLSDLQMLSAKA
ncbi:ATP synthase subunit b, mitochondrial [Cimex lectularius]|uniref:ATP synthase subunit b n=1 Tax=Cimex lectularius TaxID=79782 RepID=A0A8I6TH73_CIMLE|nr:ATP synthase subunit b, mitochondrial [Cimex lectularius]